MYERHAMHSMGSLPQFAGRETGGQARIQLEVLDLPEMQCQGCVQCVPDSVHQYIHSSSPFHLSGDKTHSELRCAQQNYGFEPSRLGAGNFLQAYPAQIYQRPAIC